MVVHTVKDYQWVNEKYPFEIFLRNELPHLDFKSKREYSEYYKQLKV